MAKRVTRPSKLPELMAAAVWRMREESTEAETIILIVGTSGRKGKVRLEFGTGNPAAVYGVLCDAIQQLEVELNIEPETEVLDDDDD